MSMPLLQRQWNAIIQFPPKILKGCRDRMLVNGLEAKVIATAFINSQRKDYGDCIGSLMILERKKPLEAFQEFLTSQKSCVTQLLLMDVSTADNLNRAQGQLCQVLEIMQLTLLHTYKLFYSSDLLGITQFGTTTQIMAKPMLSDLLQWAIASLSLRTESNPKKDLTNDQEIIVPSGACADTILNAFTDMQSYSTTFGKIMKEQLTRWIHECAKLVKQDSSKIFSAITKALHLSEIQNAVYSQCQTLTNEQFEIIDNNNNGLDQTNAENETPQKQTVRVDWNKV